MQRILPNKSQALGFLAALIFLNVVGAAVQTQFNIGHLLALGIEVPFSKRLTTTLQDIVYLQPLFGIIFGIGFLAAMIVGSYIAGWVKILPDLVFALAGFAAMGATLFSLKAAFLLTPIGAAREWDGFLSLCVVGALSGYAFSIVAARLNRTA
ncbi:MAG: hypothetical protein L7U47_08145 [Alphaproteobacteria bacterium]|nr:hypothetical protein [Alphaproteobacteria bacterium]